MAKEIHISAAPGDPSVFWQSQSGKYYRTKAEAEKDSGKALNPEDYMIRTSFFTRYKKTIIISIAISILVAVVAVWYIKK